MDRAVVIVGAGPAGAAAALTARRLSPDGDVVVIDRAAFPRDKPCGDAVSPDAVAELGRLGVATAVAGFAPVARLRLRSPSGSEVAAAPPAAGYVVPRLVFDDRLATAARAAASRWVQASVRDVTASGRRLRVHTTTGDVDADVVIAADGANSVVRRRVSGPLPARHTGIAVRGYAPLPAGAPELLLVWEQAAALAYAWSFPIDDERCNVGYGVLGATAATSRTDLVQRLARLVPHGTTADPDTIRGHRLPLSSGGTRLGRGRVLLAGDAASLINPITGEGIYYALLSGRLAAQAAVRTPAAPLTAYRSLLRTSLRAHVRSTRWVAGVAGSGPVLDLLVRAAAASPATADLLADLAFGKASLTPTTTRTIIGGIWRTARSGRRSTVGGRS